MSEAQKNNKIANSHKAIIAQGTLKRLCLVSATCVEQQPELVTNILPTTECTETTNLLLLVEQVVVYRLGDL